ncbi:bestrophin family ion channel [Olivibacter ginsenosidimutans]|uniref:Bestrophin family ion channel n=1 Tax=Olivibacter ginsenosidimutans TaxID=1176537 RepID=A0ABP9BN93_9SPHI
MLLKNNIPIGYVLGKVRHDSALVAIYAVVITILHEWKIFSFDIPIGGVPAILGTVISLLLAFRSNQAYDRWWEARIVWGSIVNDSRSFARQVITFVGNLYEAGACGALKERLIKRQIAWNYALTKSLRKQDPYEDIKRFLSTSELEFVKAYDNVPNALLKLQGMDIHRATADGLINQFQQIEMERTLTKLTDAMGKCERIKNTVFPETYTLYIRLAIYLFITVLPFSLFGLFGYVSIPLIIAIGTLFLLIEKMAVHLQDPFENKPTDTPMSTISAKIERDLLQMWLDDKVDSSRTEVNEENKDVFYIL